MRGRRPRQSHYKTAKRGVRLTFCLFYQVITRLPAVFVYDFVTALFLFFSCFIFKTYINREHDFLGQCNQTLLNIRGGRGCSSEAET